MGNGYRTFISIMVLAAFPVIYDQVSAIQVIKPRGTAFLLLKYIPVLLLLTAGLLGLRLNQIKIMLTSLLILLVYQLLMGIGFAPQQFNETDLSVTVSLTIPLSLALLLLFDETRMVSRIGLLKVAVCFLPTIVLLMVSNFQWFDVSRALGTTPFTKLPSKWVSHWAMLPLFGLVAEGLLFKDRLSKSLLIVIGFFLVPFYYILATQPYTPDSLCVTFICGSMMFVFLVIRQFWIHSYIDDLTEIPNRRALEEHLKLLPKRWCLAMVDIDHFKKFNDKYGHQAGDHVLRMVAGQLAKAPHGQVYRYGGEEFTILYRSQDLYVVGEYVDDLVDTIARRHFTIRKNESERRRTSAKDRGRQPVAPDKRVKVTISIGVTERRDGERNPNEVIERADKALYRAKKKGRNCAIVVE